LASETLDLNTFKNCYYQESQSDDYQQSLQRWLANYAERLAEDNRPFQERRDAMNAVNPLYVFRNYLAQQAIDKSEAGDDSMVNELLELFRNPYKEQEGKRLFAEKRPDWARSKVGCSMLSCSS